MNRDRIIAVFMRHFEGITPSLLSRDFSDLMMGAFDEWDSLENLNLLLEIEVEFSVRFTAEELSSIQSLEMIEQFLQAKQ